MDDVDEHVELVSERSGLLAAMEDERLDPRALRDRTGASRSTVNRALRDLEDAGLVRREEGEYGLTAAGRLALDHYRRYRRQRADLLDADPLLSSLPADTDLDLDGVLGGEVVLAPEETPYQPLQRLQQLVDDADDYRAVLPSLGDPRHLRLLYEHVVTDGDPAELVVPEMLYDSLVEEFPRRLAAMAAPDGGEFEMLVGEAPNVGLVLTETDGDPAVTVVVPGSDGGVRALVCNRTPRALRWAEDRYTRYRGDADPATGDLRQVGDGGVVVDTPDGPVAGPGLSTALEREGFVRLSREFFLDREVAAPTTAWRAGLDLAEVHTGYAVERTADDDDEPLTDRLLDGLREGRDRAVVGPPGSGKSTTAKRVACEWYDRDLGPVLYRESGRGSPFRSVEGLVATVEAAEGHALVVVEDAVRSDADAVFEAMSRLSGRGDVSFLVDARASEWRDPPGDPDRTAVEVGVERMPRLFGGDYERLVEHFERTADVDVDVPVAAISDELGLATAPDDGAVPGELLLLLHRLSLYADPLAEDRTTLDEDVAAVYDDLAGAGDGALDVAVLANLLNAAGIEVAPAYLYALAADEDGPDRSAVESAVESLDGRVLFGATDRGTYRTIHETWSVTFLATLHDRAGEEAARERVGRLVETLAALAGDADRRDRVRAAVEDPTRLDRVEDAPGEWADGVVEALYGLAHKRPKLAALFGDADGPVLEPAACSDGTVSDCAVTLGRAFLDAGEFDRAEAVFSGLTDDADADGRLAVERALGLGEAAHGRGEYDAAVGRARTALETAREAGDTRAVARCHSHLGDTAATRGEYDRAREHYERALETAREAGDRRREAIGLADLGVVDFYRNDYDAASDRLRAGLDIAEQLDDRRLEARCRHNLGLVAYKRDDHRAAIEHYERALSVYRDLGDRLDEAKSLHSLGTAAIDVGDHERGREALERSREISVEIGSPAGEAYALNNVATVDELEGDYDRARERYDRARSIARELGDRKSEFNATGSLARVAFRRGAYDRSEELFEEAVGIARDLEVPRSEVRALTYLGWIDVERGEYDRGRERLKEALETARDLEIDHEVGRALQALGILARRQGEYDRSADHLDRALELLDGSGNPVRTEIAGLEAGRTALARGDAATARERAERARETFEAKDATHWVGRTHRLLGDVDAETGRNDAAREHWREAADCFEAVDAPRDALATLQRLVETCREGDEDDAARSWCRRARSVLDSAPDPAAERHREWVEGAAAALQE